MSGETEKQILKLPMIPIRDVVVFPYMMIPFVIGRPASVRALELALSKDKRVFLATQKDAGTDNPEAHEIFSVGVMANTVQSVKHPDGNIKVLVEGVQRARTLRVEIEDGTMMAYIEVPSLSDKMTPKLTILVKKLNGVFEEYAKLNPQVNFEALLNTFRTNDAKRLADTLCASLPLTIPEKQNLLEIFDLSTRMERITEIVEIEIEKIKVDRNIQGRVKRQMERAQKEYYLNEKNKAIHKQLGRKDEKNEIDELRTAIDKARMPKEAREKALKELQRLEMMPPLSAESTVSRTYIDWLLAMPWAKRTREIRNIKRAEQVLEEDHYGLEKVKERILEFLAVRHMVQKPQGTILCFVGPPGCGKTSLGRSVARSTGKNFVRLSLGGVRDEAEVRGHRRTYIGSLPGQIIQMMKKAGVKNPVFLLDEVDKMSMDFRGDPSAALLEVLDPEQNSTFVDHYLDTEFDLSEVMFIATANVLYTIPKPLQDRMEIIDLSGYTELEKLEIAKRFLIKKQIKAAGLNSSQLTIPDDALLQIIRRYTKESGVRNLEREIGKICRKVVRKIIAGDFEKKDNHTIETNLLNGFLGVPRYRQQSISETNEIGLATGLAWTEVGGEVLLTETTLTDGRGKLTLTGKLGEVMQESAQAAITYVRSRASQYGIGRDFYRRMDMHIHIPEGAIPKDGPSAGITLATAIVSALTKIPVRSDVAMTGEITLRGKVLPIGGLKEKMLAAHREGIKTIVIPMENQKDLQDIPAEIKGALEIKLVETMDEVLKVALERPPQSQDEKGFPKTAISKELPDSQTIRH